MVWKFQSGEVAQNGVRKDKKEERSGKKGDAWKYRNKTSGRVDPQLYFVSQFKLEISTKPSKSIRLRSCRSWCQNYTEIVT